MEIFSIGTPVVNAYDSRGFISRSKAPEAKCFVIGAGMQAVQTEYEIVWERGEVSELSDGIVAPYVERAKRYGLSRIDPELVDGFRDSALDLVAARHKSAIEAREQAKVAADAFNAEVAEKTPAWAKAVIIAELIQDDSDTMSDYHGSKTKRTVILGFSKHTRDLFPELRAAAATFEETAHLATAPDSAEHREKYSMGGGFYLKDGYRHSSGWQVQKRSFYGDSKNVPQGEWRLQSDKPAHVKAEAVPVQAAPITGIIIEEHTHTTKGFTMHICILPGRVEREEFDALLAKAKGLGGWYTRPWGKTPGGFAFKSREAAEAFAGTSSGTPTPPNAPDRAPVPISTNSIAPAKFRTLADAMQGDIDHKFADRLSNTPKRQREAATARIEGWHLRRTQSAMRALAAAIETGSLPQCLATVKSKTEVHTLTRSHIDHSNAGYYDAGIDTNKPAIDNEQTRALWAMIAGQSEAEVKAETLRLKIERLQFANIPGYFPTPSDLVAQMIEAADIPDDCRVLEPSAGSGAIADAVRAAKPGAALETIERHQTLIEILAAKGHSVISGDFLSLSPIGEYDRVLMNPPFENGQDMDHVRHAHTFLKSGGRLVAIMSPGPFFRQDRKAVAFREWFEANNGERIDIAAGAFKQSGTGVATVLVTIDA